MSARKSRLIGKILTGVVTTIVAPALASVVSQRVSEWQDAVMVAVENHPPSLTANGNHLKTEDKPRRSPAEINGRSPAPAAALLPPLGQSADWSHPSPYGR